MKNSIFFNLPYANLSSAGAFVSFCIGLDVSGWARLGFAYPAFTYNVHFCVSAKIKSCLFLFLVRDISSNHKLAYLAYGSQKKQRSGQCLLICQLVSVHCLCIHLHCAGPGPHGSKAQYNTQYHCSHLPRCYQSVPRGGSAHRVFLKLRPQGHTELSHKPAKGTSTFSLCIHF